jgi:hypothetical protein
MDHNRFEGLARALGAAVSRRSLGRGLAGGGLAVLGPIRADAKKKRRKKKKTTQTTSPPPPASQQASCTPNCAERTCGSDGCGGSCGTCGANQVCQGGTCCLPESRSATCAGRCGTWTNTCGQPVVCSTCPAGQQCLSNGSCAIVCDDNADCTGGNGCSNPSVEGARHCITQTLLPLVPCPSTADCPPGSHCQDIGFGGICIGLHS